MMVLYTQGVVAVWFDPTSPNNFFNEKRTFNFLTNGASCNTSYWLVPGTVDPMDD